VLQRLDGPGRDAWAPMLLEDALYGTRVAGERVFELARAAADGRMPGRPDLAVILLLALLAGFRGRFRDADDGGEIQALCVGLFERVHERPWLRDVPWRPALVPPDEAALPGSGSVVRRLPALRPWLATLAGALVIYLVAAHLTWRAGVHDALTLADAIVERPRGTK
jgi:type VI secretion system protein ImpK